MFKAPMRAALLLAALAAVIGGSLTHAPTAHRTVDATQQIRLLSGGGGVTLPATFPAVVPIPAGKLIGASTGPGRWSLLLRMSGSAATVQRAAIAFYVNHGFTKDSTSSVHGKGYRIDMIAVNRDHSATSSNLTLVVYQL